MSTLRGDMERLSYVSREDMLYLLLEDDLYKIDIARKTYEIIQENIQQDCCVISSSQASIAWMDQMSQNASTSITVLSLESGEQYTVQAQEGQKVKALGFINEDFIYGIANDADIVTDDTGTTVFAMNTVRIQNFSGGSGKRISRGQCMDFRSEYSGGICGASACTVGG